MWKNYWLPSLLTLGLVSARTAAAKAPYQTFPSSNEVFRILLADPRQIQIAASYYRLSGDNMGDVALGHSWGMTRWYSKTDRWIWQWDLEAMAFSRFKLSGSVNEFQTIDFFANLPLEVRRGFYSGKFMLFHESSHLGDDYIRRTGDAGFRYSIDGLRGIFSVEPRDFLRIYGGPTFLFHSVPAPDYWALQSGFELTSPDWGEFPDYPIRAYLAQDFQWRENVRWNMNSRTVLGVKVGFKRETRFMRLFVGYFSGHSPYGQFFARPEHYADIGVGIDF